MRPRLPTHPATPGARGAATLLLLALTACADAPADPATGGGREADPSGHYAMAAPLASELRVVALPGREGEYRVELHGGGDPADGPGVAADCQALAEGRWQNGELVATLQAFDSPLGGLEASDLGQAPALHVRVQSDTAVVEGSFAHCPMGTAMAGTYHRTATPRLLADCAPLPAACWNRD